MDGASVGTIDRVVEIRYVNNYIVYAHPAVSCYCVVAVEGKSGQSERCAGSGQL